jgi:hypothetical protein
MCDKGGYQVHNRPSLLSTAMDADNLYVPPRESCFQERYRDAYRAEIEHFLDVLEGNFSIFNVFYVPPRDLAFRSATVQILVTFAFQKLSIWTIQWFEFNV